MADIWASTEEIEYEQSIGSKSSLAMEGVDQIIKEDEPYVPKWMRKKQDSIAKKTKLDNNMPVDDPCCPNSEGYGEYRDREQIERQTKEVAGLKRQQHDHAVKQVLQHETTHQLLSPLAQPPSQMISSYNTQQLIWYYKDNTSGNIQGPFSGEQMMGWRAFFPLFTPVRFGNGIFLPLSEVNFMNPPISSVPPPPETKIEEIVSVATRSIDNGAEYYELNSAQDALDTSVPLESTEVNVTQSEVELCVPPPSDDEDDNYGSDVEDDDDNAARSRNGKYIDPEVDICIPPPSDDDEEENDDNDVSDKDDDRELDHCVPPPHDADEGDESQIITSYPVDEEVPYPDDVEYPVDEAYSYSDTGGAYYEGEMSAVAPYPTATDVVFGVADNLDSQTEDHELLPPIEARVEEKKEYTGDKAVVGMIPSHLRIKRKQVKSNKKPLAPSKAHDDYSKFMDEITKLT
jgi:hypothetical protein